METRELDVIERIVAREVLPHGECRNAVIEPGSYQLAQIPNPLNGSHMDWLVLSDRQTVGGSIGWWQDRVREGEVEIDGM